MMDRAAVPKAPTSASAVSGVTSAFLLLRPIELAEQDRDALNVTLQASHVAQDAADILLDKGAAAVPSDDLRPEDEDRSGSNVQQRKAR